MRYFELHESKAVKELKDKLPSLKHPNYDTIDNLMKRISKRYDMSGKKLHDLFVSRYGHTPDHWIKAYNNKLENINEFAPGNNAGGGNYFQELASAWYNDTYRTGSLDKGIKSKQDIERLLQRGIVCPDGVTRKYGIDYNSDFDGVVISSDDYYEHADYDDTIDSRTGQKWGPYDYMEFGDEELDEATGDTKFDTMMSQMTSEPKYPDQDMPPTSIPELIQWANKNNKPYHEYFAQWARKNGFKNVNDALVWFGDNVDPSNPWGPKDFIDPFGRPAAEELEDAAKHDPKARELMKVFGCYEEIVFDWSDEYRQMNMPTSRKGTDEGLNEFAPSNDDSNEPDEDEILKRLAKQWWLGTEQDMIKAERTLASMGWEIGEDEGSYDNGGVFVVRAGDVNGNSYMSWPHEDLSELDEDTIDMPFGSISGQDVDIGLQYQSEQRAYSGLKRLGLVDTGEQFLTLQEIAKLVTDSSNIHIFAFDTNPVRSYVKLIKMIGWNKDNPTQYDKSKLAEGEVLPLKRPMSKVQHGKKTFPPTQRNVTKPEKNVIPLKKDNVKEEVSNDKEKIKNFIKWSIRRLHIKQPYPKIILSTNTEKAQAGHHTGVHNIEDNTIWVYTGNRNLIDILRTVFHELVHERQSQLNMIKPGDSYPGSPIEAMADMLAGKYIKIYGKDHPEIFQ
jgi:hypothetical protein